MKIKDIVRLIYWEGVPLLTGFVLFRYAGVDKANSVLDVAKIFISNLYIIIPVIIVHIMIGNTLFKKNETHSAKCPDDYTCPTLIEK